MGDAIAPGAHLRAAGGGTTALVGWPPLLPPLVLSAQAVSTPAPALGRVAPVSVSASGWPAYARSTPIPRPPSLPPSLAHPAR